MKTENFDLNIGDEIAFVILAKDAESNDRTIYFPVAEVCEADGERAYRYQYPDGELSHGVIRQSELVGHSVKINVEAETVSNLICLSDRKEEFMQALNRAKNSDLIVYADFEPDTFVVVNRGKSEYRVKLQTVSGQLYAECGCPDFKFRKRICKHIGEVLTETVCGTLAKA